MSQVAQAKRQKINGGLVVFGCPLLGQFWTDFIMLRQKKLGPVEKDYREVEIARKKEFRFGAEL